MTAVEKVKNEIQKTKLKISEQQKRLRILENKLIEEQNIEILEMVKSVNIERNDLAAFLNAYSEGKLTLPSPKCTSMQHRSEEEQ